MLIIYRVIPSWVCERYSKQQKQHKSCHECSAYDCKTTKANLINYWIWSLRWYLIQLWRSEEPRSLIRLPKPNFGFCGFKQLWGSGTTCIVKLSCLTQKFKGLKPGSLFLWIPDNPWFKPFIMSKTTAFWITEMVNYWSWVYTGMKRVNHKLAGNTCNNAFQLILQCNIVRQWPYFLDLIILLLNRPVLISFTRIRFLSYSGDINHAHKICIFLYGSVNKN